jgi:hypothetical protein
MSGTAHGASSMSAAPRAAGPGRGAWWLFAVGIVLYLTLSAQGLLALGVPYDAPWGPMVAKLHPGTWVIGIAYVRLLCGYGHPVRVAAAQFAAQPAFAVYLACIVFVFGYSVARYGPSGAAFIVDTLVMPVLCAFCVAMLDARRRQRLLVLVVVLLVANTLLGLAESVMQARLIPMRLAGQPEVAEDFFRPSALLGHPLTNSLVTATLLPLVLYLRIATAWRVMLALLLWVGVLAFGGRTSFVLATVFYGGWFGARTLLAALRGRFSYVQLSGGAVLAMVAACGLAGAIAASGVGERIFKSLQWDNSASVRTRIWNVFDYMSDQAILVGVSPADITDLMLRLGLSGPGETIENFWLYMLVQLGVVGFLPFAVAMLCIMGWLWRSSTGAMRLSVLIFFISASSNNSLASKSISLSMLVVAVALTRRLQPALHRRRSASAMRPVPAHPLGSNPFASAAFAPGPRNDSFGSPA